MKAVAWLPLALTLFGTTSCVESKQPLSDAKTSKLDERLLGTWSEEKGNDAWKVTRRKGFENVLRVVSTKPDAKDSPAFAYTTQLKDRRYLTLEVQEKDLATFFILRYDLVDNDTLKLYPLLPDSIAKAIDAKELAGKVQLKKGRGLFGFGDEGRQVTLTDQSDAIARFLDSKGDDCFSDQDVFVLKRKAKE